MLTHGNHDHCEMAGRFFAHDQLTEHVGLKPGYQVWSRLLPLVTECGDRTDHIG